MNVRHRWVACLLAVGLGAPAMTIAAPKGEEQRVAESVERALQKHGGDVHRCFEKALADRLDVAGQVEVQVEVGGAGLVKSAEVLSKGKDVPKELSACIQTAAKSWTIEDVEPGASVVLPFSFEGQAGQFVIKVADVPDRGPQAAKGRGGAKSSAPFTVKVLADPVNVRAPNASLTLLSIGPASRVAMHRHPRSAKILYLLQGKARVLGPPGAQPMKASDGTAIFLPANYPHVIENMGRQQPAVFLQIFAPPGPEKVYRDPHDPDARTDFEVIRDPRKAKAPPGAKPHVADRDSVRAVSSAGGKVSARILIDHDNAGSDAISLAVVEYAAGTEVARHAHTGASELVFVQTGSGKATVGSETMSFGGETALYFPPDQPHAMHFAAPTTAVEIFAPGGAEQSFHGKAK